MQHIILNIINMFCREISETFQLQQLMKIDVSR